MHAQRLGANSFVQTIRSAFVQQIEPTGDALSVKEQWWHVALGERSAAAYIDFMLVWSRSNLALRS
jgi:hypothetical protein